MLFDEIDKAHPDTLDLFLQLFDEGRLTDSQGRTVDGRHAIFFMTSNIPAEAAQARPLGFVLHGDSDTSSAIPPAVRDSFRPEFLDRLDEIVMFRPLAMKHLAKIAGRLLHELSERAAERDVALEFEEDAVRMVCESGNDREQGARPLARAVERLVSRPLSDALLSGEIEAGGRYLVSASGGRMVFNRIA